MAETLPKEISRGIVQIGPVDLEMVVLDDGSRLVTPESLAKLLEWLGHDCGPMAEIETGAGNTENADR